jgi:hypothetical protein
VASQSRFHDKNQWLDKVEAGGRNLEQNGYAPFKATSPGGSSISFRLPAAQAVGGAGLSDVVMRIVEAFAPGNPVVSARYFVGRTKQLSQLIDAIEEHRNHLLVSGPRGCGKTSLALTLLSAARRADYTTVYVSCSRGSTFESVVRPALAGISRRYDANSDPADEVALSTFVDLLPSSGITPQIVGELLSRVSGTRVLIVLDEFDLQRDNSTTRDLVELMKKLSDHAAPVHLILVGTANSLEDILGPQPSIPRSLFKLKLNHMSDEEIGDVLSQLTRLVDMQITPQVMKEVLTFAEGKLFIAKLVALRAAKTAAMRNASMMETEDFEAAFNQLRDHFNSEGLAALEKVVNENRSLRFIFLAIIRTVREVGDSFTASQVAKRCKNALGVQGLEAPKIELILASLAESGNVLVKSKRDGEQAYHFVDPNIELALALVSYQALLNHGDSYERVTLIPSEQQTPIHS